MEKSHRGAVFLLISLAVSVAGGTWSVVHWAASHGVALLIATAFLTTILAALSAWVAVRTWRAQRDANDPSAALLLPTTVRRGLWHLLSRQQWNILMLGLTAVAALTGTFTAAEVLLNGHPSAVAPPPASSPTPLAPPATTAAAQPAGSPPAQVTASPSDSSASPTDKPTASPSAAPGATAYLDTIDAVNGRGDAQAVTFSGKRFPRSLVMYCHDVTSNYIEWNVAGYNIFNATLGVPDDTSYAFGGVAELIFYDQDGHQLGKRYDVSLGHAQQVQLSLTGVVHLRVTCSGRDAKTNEVRGFAGALGDATIAS